MSFDVMMKELQKEYISELPEKIIKIRFDWSKGESQLVREHFHKLKGTGRTYGLPEVTDLGAHMEHLCCTQPETAMKLVEVALELLAEIHTTRLDNRAYDILKDPRFKLLEVSLPSVA